MKKVLLCAQVGLIALLATSTGTMAQSTEALMNSGQEMVQRGAFDQAVAAFRKALAREPDFFEAQFNLAFAYLQWGRNTEAVAEFKKALGMQPRNSEAWSNLAIAYDNLNRPGDAMNALDHAVQYDPGNLNARMNLAAMYANANKNQQAIGLYKQVIKADGSNGEAYLNLSKCLIATKNVKEAKEYLKQAVANLPGKGDPHVELGHIYWKYENDVDKGIKEFETAISVDPSNPSSYQELASALESKGKRTEAADALRKSLTYIDDVLAKDKVQDRIDRLEKGATGTGSGGQSNEDAKAQMKAQTEDLERELRGAEQKSTRSMSTAPVNVSNDFADVAADTSSWDIQKEAQKRAADKKGEAKPKKKAEK
jgi:tetratricopeptide (TPR) repeat protein